MFFNRCYFMSVLNLFVEEGIPLAEQDLTEVAMV